MSTLFGAFEAKASHFTNKTALIHFHQDTHYTYSDLLARINKMSVHFSACYDIQLGDRVGILMTNLPEFIMAFFALQRLGAVVVPLSYRLSYEEFKVILKDAGIKGIVSSQEFAETLPPLLPHLTWHYIVEDLDFSQSSEHQPIYPTLNPHDLAVLIYTSGTTGKPKGVMLSHMNLLTDAQLNSAVINATAEDIFVTASPLFHVFGLVNMMLTSLLAGATLVLVKKFKPKWILEAVTRYKITFLAGVPTMYQMMLPLLPSKDYDLRSLRVCHSGAAPMPKAVLEKIETLFSAPVQEGYGQSEASSIMTCNPLLGTRKPGSVGLPLPGLTVEIVDEGGKIADPGEIGELRAKGDTVMLGYWQNPEASAKALREGWLYTRDLGYKDDEGYIYLMGREDDLINVGGAKVYPQDVENVLYQHPAVMACAVKGQTSELYHQVVVAYVVLQPDKPVTALELQKFCREFLADYKVPHTIHFVEDIPKNPAGKILRGQLL